MDYMNEAVNFLYMEYLIQRTQGFETESHFDEVITTMIEEWPAQHVSCDCHMSYIMWYSLVASALLYETRLSNELCTDSSFSKKNSFFFYIYFFFKLRFFLLCFHDRCLCSWTMKVVFFLNWVTKSINGYSIDQDFTSFNSLKTEADQL